MASASAVRSAADSKGAARGRKADESEDESDDEDETESGDGADDGDGDEESEEAAESDDDSESADDESTGPPVIEQVTAALDSIGNDSEESSGGFGDLDALSDEELEELAGTLVDELNKRSEQ